MTKRFGWALVMAGWTGLAMAQAKVSPVVSPEVLQDHRVVFRLRAADAKEVTVAGDFWLQQNRTEKLVKGEDGVWSLTTEALGSDLYSYWLTVDGVKMPDPANGMTKPGISETQSAFFVPGAGADLLQGGKVPHGEVREVLYQSGLAGRTCRMHVYLPPGYERGSKLPVVYLMHGGGDDDGTWESVGRVNFMMDNLIAQGKAKPMVLVMPALWVLGAPVKAGDRDRNEALFARALREEIVPYVEGHFKVRAGVGNRAVGGLGDGRNFLPTVVWQTMGSFGSVVFVSGGADAERVAALDAAYPGVVGTAKGVKFYMGDGVNDGSYASAKNLADELKRRGYGVQFVENEGTHGWPEFRYNFMRFAESAFR